MRTRAGLVALIVLPMLAVNVQAGGSLSIRLVEASNSGHEVSPGLKDVAGILKGSLAFSNYKLLGSSAMRLPALGEKGQVGDYEVTCHGDRQNLSITVIRGKNVMLTTQVRIQEGLPLILGGFLSGAGRHMLVFTLR